MADDPVFIDMGLEKIFKDLKLLDKTHVEIGITDDVANKPTADGRLTMGDLAKIQEYGTKDIPARPFVKSVEHSKKVMPAATKVLDAALTFQDTDRAYAALGEQLAREMRDGIYHGDFEANADSTVAKKGFNHPLLETGELADNITYRLVRGSGDTVGEAEAEFGDFESFSVEGE